MTVLKGFVDDSLKRQSFFMVLRSATAFSLRSFVSQIPTEKDLDTGREMTHTCDAFELDDSRVVESISEVC